MRNVTRRLLWWLFKRSAVRLHVRDELRGDVLLLKPEGGPVRLRVVALRGVPYQRVKPGDRFMVELEVVGDG